MRVHVVDPAAYTPPYDHALCSALAAAGADVTLFTSTFDYGAAPAPVGYERREFFYRAGAAAGPVRRAAAGRSRAARTWRTGARLAQHVPDMLRYRGAARAAEIVHFQWLAVQQLDLALLPRRADREGARRALVLTAHDVLPREPRAGQRAAQARLYARMDAIVVHSARGRERLIEQAGVAPERVHVIPHGVLRPWRGAAAELSPPSELSPPPGLGRAAELGGPAELSLPPELGGAGEGPVVLMAGLLRPYKGLEDLLRAWLAAGEELPRGAELWVVGMPRMDVAGLRAAVAQSEVRAGQSGGTGRIRAVLRFVSDAELGALLERAQLLVLPYREIDQSGMAYAGLGAGVPLLLSDAGGFGEIAATGAARTFAAGDVGALRAALGELLGDGAARAQMAARGRAGAEGVYSWTAIARSTLDLYERLLRENQR